jgi:benzoylformate decarboxylase
VQGKDILLSILETEGVRHIFGNPGTTELGLMDALAAPEGEHFDYVLSLQEATVVAMADGYAQASGRPAFVNVHTMAGLGNAIGNLTNAVQNRTPLVVTAGNADRRHLIADPLLSGNLVGLAAGVSKWGHEVRHADELGVVMRRAFADAAAPPAGPVFVGIPQDVLEEEAGEAVTVGSPVPPRSPVAPLGPAAGLDQLADLLVASDRLAIVAGEEVGHGGAVAALVELAEALGCRVWGSPLHAVSVFPSGHPLWAGPLPSEAARIRAIIEGSGVDRVLLVGSQAFLVYPWSPGPPLPEQVELLQLASERGSVGRTHPVRLGLVGDVRASLVELTRLVSGLVAAPSLEAAATAYQLRVDAEEAAALDRYDAIPMDPAACVHALLRALPDDVTVIDEAITTGTAVRRYHRTTNPGRYFFCRGGGLGWGMPAACGVSLARDSEPVLCIVGDGSAMYSPQALWTAASRRLPVVFAVVNNQQYAILKANLRRMGGVSAATGRFVGMDLADPPVDFSALAVSMGVAATRIDKAADVGPAAEAAWRSGQPALLELPISAP